MQTILKFGEVKEKKNSFVLITFVMCFMDVTRGRPYRIRKLPDDREILAGGGSLDGKKVVYRSDKSHYCRYV